MSDTTTIPKPLERKHPYPLIDTDPTAGRVLAYMRPTDYAQWAGYTAGTPALLYAWEKIDRTGGRMRPYMYTGAVLGCVAGFFVAYSRSTKRFWGWTENEREVKRDYEELSERARQGLPLWGESSQPEWVQAVAHRNSQYSALNLALFPMLNLVNHPYHGKDPKSYGTAEIDASTGDKKAE
ncbi:hypothetical protein HMN09_01346100 [Mycena chlorophos]|uniref:NADH-ubiquinone oxidoreductase 21 kDa subunit n=1 Tax=Mycena chlorophos TaxID=658473 RepID=A0A8H6RY86_MYCCL|nr:hypothetical protein HMN09_01346100 [Mycena chlorophos]